MKLSISNIAWNAGEDAKVYVLMRKYGYSGLEIAPTRIFSQNPYDRLEEAGVWSRGLYDRHGFQISSMQSIWHGRSENMFQSPKQRDILEEYTKKAIDFASAIGCPNLVFGCPRNRNIPEEKTEWGAVEFFRKIASYALYKHTAIGIEANPVIYHTNYINDTKAALSLLKQVNSDGFKLNLDTGAMAWNKEKPEILAGSIGKIGHVHISEPGLMPIKDWGFCKELCQVLKAEGYGGFISIEMKQCKDENMLEHILGNVAEIFG